ncbi:MAG: DUF4831 family protein [Paludibacteraceae bacterium]|nr:DUF4831 family protein [Paludibacteraceae bacterium]
MKTKTLLLTVLLMAATGMSAQALQFVVEYEQIVNERGELYQYSERYLGPTSVIEESSTTYRLTAVKPYTQPGAKPTTKGTATTGKQRIEVEPQLPLSEGALMAGSTAKKAELVAKQIYRIRETRMNILAGDVEHIPQDGKAMALVLKELNREEKALTAMFVGKQIITSKRKIVTYVEGNELLLRFSRFAGPVAQDDLSGEPVYIHVINHTEQRLAAQQPSKKSEPRIYEEHVVSRSVTVSYNENTLLDALIQ